MPWLLASPEDQRPWYTRYQLVHLFHEEGFHLPRYLNVVNKMNEMTVTTPMYLCIPKCIQYNGYNSLLAVRDKHMAACLSFPDQRDNIGMITGTINSKRTQQKW